jgi:hypothetical protein
MQQAVAVIRVKQLCASMAIRRNKQLLQLRIVPNKVEPTPVRADENENGSCPA